MSKTVLYYMDKITLRNCFKFALSFLIIVVYLH